MRFLSSLMGSHHHRFFSFFSFYTFSCIIIANMHLQILAFFYFLDSLSKLIITTLPRVSFILSRLIKHSKLGLIIFIHKFGLMLILLGSCSVLLICLFFIFKKRQNLISVPYFLSCVQALNTQALKCM